MIQALSLGQYLSSAAVIPVVIFEQLAYQKIYFRPNEEKNLIKGSISFHKYMKTACNVCMGIVLARHKFHVYL